MVTVVVRAFNVEPWIRIALDSILAQQTDYSYEIIIGEDCSSDRTLSIAKEYALKYENIIVVTNEHNRGPVGKWIDCVRRGSGKYIMICDADDWWHNPNKIQMQVDLMEAHPECVICHSDYDNFSDKSLKTMHNCNKRKGVTESEGSIQKLLYGGKSKIVNVTSCYRRSVFEEHVPLDEYEKLGLLGDDYPTWVILSAYGEVRYLPISTATYRTGNVSMTREPHYEKVHNRYETEKRQARWLLSMFPHLGTYTEDDEQYYNKYCSHQLLLAAYRNDDYASAHKFAKQDKMPNWKTIMARTWLTFKLARWYSNRK